MVSLKEEFLCDAQILLTLRQPNKAPPMPMTEIEEMLKVKLRPIRASCSLHFIVFRPVG
jgi:hypothetical protein